MAKINLNFNNKNYSIDESILASATNDLKSHLSTTMSGTGATINLGGTTYNIDSTKLTAATNDFVSHLGTISGEGEKINVGGVEISIDSTKISSAFDSFNAALNDLVSGGGSGSDGLAPGLYKTGAIALYEAGDLEAASAMLKISWEDLEASGAIAISEGEDIELPEMNEYGFYYGVPYSGNVEDITMSFTFNEDGSLVLNEAGYIVQVPTGVIIFSDHSIDMTEIGLFVFEVSSEGTQIGADGLVFSLSSGLPPKGSVYSSIIDGEPPVLAGDLVLPNDGRATSISAGTFMGQTTLTSVVIPNSVISIGENAFRDCSLTSVVIGDNVTFIGAEAFADCDSLTSVVIGDSVTYIGYSAFFGCNNLADITYNGTTAQWSAITKGNNWNYNVPATHVTCSDGTVAL